jgi:RimJ/RimL family protein N-acetyltransferase
VTDLAPLYDLRLRTPRLELRLGSHEELVDLARLAEQGVHPPEEMPFAVAWTDRIGKPDFIETSVGYHEQHLADWSPEKWQLNLLVWESGELVGTQGMLAEDFRTRRTVHTGSWLGRRYQRRGVGTEMRAAMLELAFRGLGASRAESSWLEGNEASRRVSAKLGYVEYAVGEQSPRGAPVVEHGVEIQRDAWRCTIAVEIENLDPCLPLFGVTRASGP